ncbi:MAG: DUF1080 domain-containing protein, partial [Salegentibacter mishustinae]|nr:DUF1080 domain-containing protein [Salegentibacter mishustinae]
MKKNILILVTAAVIVSACKSDKKENKADETSTAQDTTAMASNEDNWNKLFNGENLEGWKAFNADSISDQWQVKDGVIAFTPAEGDR